jgi:hypothetical protein
MLDPARGWLPGWTPRFRRVSRAESDDLEDGDMARLAIIAIAFFGMMSLGTSADAIGLAAHRAIYDLSLADSGAGTAVNSVSGRMVMEFTGSQCAGYTTNLRFVTQTEDSDGQRQVTDSRSSTFEAGDGKRLDFTNQTYTDEALAEESRGSANRKDSDIAVALTKPADKKFDLSSAIVFPTEQMQKIISAAQAGERFVSLDVYDGSEDGETVFTTAGVIGPEIKSTDDVGTETVVKDAGMAGLRHWPLTISYFDKKQTGDAAPFYVMSFVIYENGVGRSLKIDYGDFALDGQLTRLDMLPAAPCPGGG